MTESREVDGVGGAGRGAPRTAWIRGLLQRWLRQGAAAALRDTLLLALLVVAAVVHVRAFRDYVFEDAYITYRYAENLAAGRGFVFNPGERVLGTSTPLYAMVLAALRLFGLEVPMASALVFSASLSLVALAGARLLRRFGHPNLGVAWAWLVLGGVGGISWCFGMETPFYVLLLLLTLLAALADRPVATGVLLGLAFLTRYDGALLTVPLFVALWWRRRRPPWVEATVSAAVVAPWLLFAQLYFGGLFPNTLAAKTGTASVAGYMYESVQRLVAELPRPIDRALGRELPPVADAVLLLLLIGPIFAQSAAVFRRQRVLSLLLIFPLLLWLGYSWIGPPLGHRWHMLPAMYLMLALALLCWGEVARGLGGRRWTAVAAVVALAWSLALVPAGIRREAADRLSEPIYESRVAGYERIARWIRDRGLTELTLLSLEPGYLGFRAGNPVIDAAGLVTEGIFFHGTIDRRDAFSGLVEERRPDLVVTSRLTAASHVPEGYLRVLEAAPTRVLWMRRETLEAHLEGVAAGRLEGGDRQVGDAVAARHPVRFDFEEDPTLGWLLSYRHRGVEELPELTFDGRANSGGYLTTYEAWGLSAAATSPPFRIDFDLLDFLFSAHHPYATAVELLVGGSVVLRRTGRPDLRDRFERVVWPVHSWRGQVGMLRLFDNVRRREFVAVDRVRSHRYRGVEPVEGFESERYGPRWLRSFGEGPCGYRQLAPRYGLPTILGRFTAASACGDGEELVSRPFTVPRDRLAFVALDFGDRRTGIEVRVDGRAVRSFTGRASGRLAALVWDVTELRGREAVLAVTDRDPRPERWIGIDDLVFFDRLEPPLE